jgi:hypothetical protein
MGQALSMDLPRSLPTVKPTSSMVIGNELRFVTSIDKHVGAGPPSPTACVALNQNRTARFASSANYAIVYTSVIL